MAHCDQEIPLVGNVESDLEAEATPSTGSGRPRGPLAAIVVGVVACAALLASAHSFGASSPAEASMEDLIGESHFTQQCSFKCNRDFMGKDAIDATADYLKCCSLCPGSTCTFPCTDTCRQKRDKALAKCDGSDVLCTEPVETVHATCCSTCPGKVCIAKSIEKITQSAAPSAPVPAAASTATPTNTAPVAPAAAAAPAPVLAEASTATPAKTAPAAPAAAAAPSPGTGGCPDGQERFAGICFKKCSELTNNEYPFRMAGLTCCKTQEISCQIEVGQSITEIRLGAIGTME